MAVGTHIKREVSLYKARKDEVLFKQLARRYRVKLTAAREMVVQAVRRIHARDAEYIAELRRQRTEPVA